MTHVQQPSLQQYGTVATDLVNAYEFLKNDEGAGQVSVVGLFLLHSSILSLYTVALLEVVPVLPVPECKSFLEEGLFSWLCTKANQA